MRQAMPRNSRQRRKPGQIDRLVLHFNENRHLFEAFAKSLVAIIQTSPILVPLLHSVLFRIKDPSSLRGKLVRLAQEYKKTGKAFDIDENNLFQKINDLAGIRLLHLHTEQVAEINTRLLAILNEQRCRLIEGPIANCWDIEYQELFRQYEIKTRSRNSMYTTVHYVVQANQRTKITCEIQVRTLMDEVWGEVSHRVNCPDESPSRSCRDQLKVLARVTTAGIRLVDSIFKSHNEIQPVATAARRRQ